MVIAQVISRFDEIRPTGINTNELSDVLTKSSISNSVETNLFPSQLNKALENGQNVIVQVSAGSGRHFFIVDKVEYINGVKYYMTRDPYTGPRGVKASMLDSKINNDRGINAIIIGK